MRRCKTSVRILYYLFGIHAALSSFRVLYINCTPRCALFPEISFFNHIHQNSSCSAILYFKNLCRLRCCDRTMFQYIFENPAFLSIIRHFVGTIRRFISTIRRFISTIRRFSDIFRAIKVNGVRIRCIDPNDLIPASIEIDAEG